MKKLFLGSAAFVVLSMGSSTLAADLKAPVLKAPPPPPPVVYNWTGCYIGGNVGGGWAKTEHLQIGKVTPPLAIIPPNDFGTSEDSNLIGGAQIGCDYQMGSWVVGAQGMFDFGKINSAHVLPAFPTFNSQNRTKDIFTATGRVGYLFAPSMLAYVKGGGAWTRTDYAFFGTVPFTFLSESASAHRSGWTVGGGFEWMFAPSWSVFGEYNYMDFGNRDTSFVRGPLAVVNSEDVVRTKLTAQTALVGINYRFNWAAPLVAKN